jgi:uncharacterized protein (TIGR02117 family)
VTTRGGALLLSLLVLAAGCVAALPPPAAAPPGEGDVTLWVVDHGWHTAIVVRRDDVDRARWPEVDDLPRAELVEVAWGDREFYMATPATAWMAITAAFGSGASVLHVVALDGPVAKAFPASARVERRVPRAGLDALGRFLSDTYERDAAGRAVRLGPGLYGASAFYAARGRYSLANTCNTWVARALQTAGLPVDPSGVVTAGAVMRQLRPR